MKCVLLSLALFLNLIATVYGITGECSAPSDPFWHCDTRLLIIIDANSYQPYSSVEKAIEFIKLNVLNHVSFYYGQQIGFFTFGRGGVQYSDLYNNYGEACEVLENIQANIERAQPQNVSLASALHDVAAYYSQTIALSELTLISFLADPNSADIAAAQIVVNNELPSPNGIVAYNNGAPMDGFPASAIWFYPDDNFGSKPGMANCILQNSCRLYRIYCDDEAPPTPWPDAKTQPPLQTVYPVTNRIPATQATMVPIGPTAVASVAPSVAPTSSKLACKCQYNTSWNDIMFLFDASTGMTAKGLDEAIAHVQSDMSFFNIQKSGYKTSQFYTQVGVISYASKPTLVGALGSMDGDDVQNLEIQATNDAGTNLQSAIQMASAQFDSSAHRRNSRKVIMVLASTYRSGGQNAPAQVANTFKESGGIIIAFDYVQLGGLPEPMMMEIASPGYFFDSRTATGMAMRQAYCNANCFCPNSYESYQEDATMSPTSGCYFPLVIPINNAIANNNCKMYNQGYLATDEEMNKTIFLASIVMNNNFWIGLKYDPLYQVYRWADGSPLSQSYQPWLSSLPSPPSSTQQCVRIVTDGFNSHWIPSDCRESYYSVCQASPCDSTNYCSNDQ